MKCVILFIAMFSSLHSMAGAFLCPPEGCAVGLQRIEQRQRERHDRMRANRTAGLFTCVVNDEEFLIPDDETASEKCHEFRVRAADYDVMEAIGEAADKQRFLNELREEHQSVD